MVTFTEEILNGKLHFFVQCKQLPNVIKRVYDKLKIFEDFIDWAEWLSGRVKVFQLESDFS